MAEIKDFPLARAARQWGVAEDRIVRGASARSGALHFLMTRPPGRSDFVELRNDAGEVLHVGKWQPVDTGEAAGSGYRLCALVVDRWPPEGSMHKGGLHFVTRRPPGPELDFVELENGLGQSLGSDVAHWRKLPNGLWDLVVPHWP